MKKENKEFMQEMAWSKKYIEKFNKIDKRKKYILVLDVETAGTTKDALTYDIGFAMIDKRGNIYEKASYIVKEIFFDEREKYSNPELMDTAYYADKLPKYFAGIKSGKWKVESIWKIRREIKQLMERYGCHTIAAYNAAFDTNALNNTVRWVANRQGITCKWFFPYGTEIMCIWNIATQTILNRKGYFKIADNNMWVKPSGNVETSAERAYAYISREFNFVEDHTGLADVEIETKILAKCLAQNKKLPYGKGIYRLCWRTPQKDFKEYIASLANS